MLTFTWRSLVQRVRRLWRSSLQLRTVAITVLLSTVAVTIISGYMSISIATNLYEARKNQALAEARQATVSVQELFDSSVSANGTIDVEAVNRTAQTRIRSVASSPGGTEFAILRTPGQTTEVTMTPGRTRNLDESVISDELKEKVGQDDGQLYTQAVTLGASTGRPDPGLVVGGVFEVPTAGQYELYLVYNVRDVQQTLDFVQQTLVIGSLLLVGTIGLVTYFVTRLTIGPVRIAAETAEKLAEGELDRRIPERGEDIIATLARSFNRMADSLQRQITQLAALSRVQQRFVSDVSHELRTPLTTIRLAGDVLYEQRDQFSPTTARTAELLHAQVDRFESMLADLLEMSRYDAGAVRIDHDDVRLAEFVLQAVDHSGHRGVPIEIDADLAGVVVRADKRRLARVLANLLDNAAKYGDGATAVSLRAVDGGVQIAVEDRGPGVPEEERSQIFDRFNRGGVSGRRGAGEGTGLGLALVAEHVRLHGGRVWVEDRLDGAEGARFVVELPADEEHA